MNCEFSVIISVYEKDKPEFVRIAFDSMLFNQTIVPSEIVLVQDGPIPSELNTVINEYKKHFPMILNIIRLEHNRGLGNALMIGVNNAKYDLVARMDSDDICLPNRFEIQLKYMELHPDVDIVGGQITEFISSPDNIISIREVPLDNDSIYQFMKSRCALNHVTVMFRRHSVLKVGNYQDWYWNEDYYLWIRMINEKCIFANLPDVLVNVRSGLNQYERRGGKKYYESEKNIKKLQLEYKMISKIEYIYYIVQRYIVQILMPDIIRGWFFRTFIRKRVKKV